MSVTNLTILRNYIKRTNTEMLRMIDDAINGTEFKTPFKEMTIEDKMQHVIKEVYRYGSINKNQKYPLKYNKIICYILTDYLHISTMIVARKLEYKTHVSVITNRNIVRSRMEGADKFDDIMWSTREILKNLGYEKE
jgi:hypothetical protein